VPPAQSPNDGAFWPRCQTELAVGPGSRSGDSAPPRQAAGGGQKRNAAPGRARFATRPAMARRPARSRSSSVPWPRAASRSSVPRAWPISSTSRLETDLADERAVLQPDVQPAVRRREPRVEPTRVGRQIGLIGVEAGRTGRWIVPQPSSGSAPRRSLDGPRSGRPAGNDGHEGG
jgi:hypothetical protein